MYQADYAEPDSWQVWAEPLDRWLATLGRHVFEVVPFEVALIGEEVGGQVTAAEIAENGVGALGTIAALWPENGHLTYYLSDA
jgi:hypothetical protein